VSQPKRDPLQPAKTPGKRHVPTEQSRNEVSAWATVQHPHHQIAILLNISTPTLLKHYRHELDLGEARGCGLVAKTLFTMATVDKNLGALCFIAKCRMGYRETAVIQNQLLDKDGNAVDQPKLGISWSDGGPGLPRKDLTDERARTDEPENANEDAESAQRH
jgi:hypothetical protein